MTKYCPECGTENSDKNERCLECSYNLSWVKRVVEKNKDEDVILAKVMYCNDEYSIYKNIFTDFKKQNTQSKRLALIKNNYEHYFPWRMSHKDILNVIGAYQKYEKVCIKKAPKWKEFKGKYK